MHPKPIVHAQQQRVFDYARNADAYAFFNVLTGPWGQNEQGEGVKSSLFDKRLTFII